MELIPVRHVDVEGLRMAYRELGDGDPIVLLHGNPTSSYLWRNVQPSLARYGRTIAIDLLGMGESDKVARGGDASYSFTEHRRYLAATLQALGVTEGVVLIGHDWGACLTFDWAAQHSDAVRGVAFTETMVRPRSFAEEGPDGQRMFGLLRGPDGEGMVLRDNFFLEQVLPGGMLTALAETDHDVYRQPFLQEGESRRAMLTWTRQIPFDGTPEDVTDIATHYSEWLRHSTVPKLFIRAEPGAVITGETIEFCRTFPNQHEVVVRASHFVPEDAPLELTRALAEWIFRLPAAT